MVKLRGSEPRMGIVGPEDLMAENLNSLEVVMPAGSGRRASVACGWFWFYFYGGGS